MTLREVRVASCEGKTRFDTRALALQIAERAANRGTTRFRNRRSHVAKERTRPRDVYRCKFCGGWHIGTSSDV